MRIQWGISATSELQGNNFFSSCSFVDQKLPLLQPLSGCVWWGTRRGQCWGQHLDCHCFVLSCFKGEDLGRRHVVWENTLIFFLPLKVADV